MTCEHSSNDRWYWNYQEESIRKWWTEKRRVWGGEGMFEENRGLESVLEWDLSGMQTFRQSNFNVCSRRHRIDFKFANLHYILFVRQKIIFFVNFVYIFFVHYSIISGHAHMYTSFLPKSLLNRLSKDFEVILFLCKWTRWFRWSVVWRWTNLINALHDTVRSK